MKIFKRICSIVLIFTISAFIISFSQNIIFRTSGVYNFYFNDSRSVDKVYTSLSSSEMAEEISGFMSSWKPDKFEVLEYTGYDYESVFSEVEGENMMAVKFALDISGIVCIISLILTVAIYIMFLREGKKKILSDMFKISVAVTALTGAAELILVSTHQGRGWLLDRIGIVPMGAESQLLELLGVDFIHMAAIFLGIITVVVTAAAIYANYLLTKPPRMFY